MRRYRVVVIVCSVLLLAVSCGEKKDDGNTLFRVLPSGKSGISFSNQLEYTEALNIYTFKNFYNGGGVGIADINNDSLPDIFFCGNQVPSKLFLNKGNLTFEDISIKAGLGTSAVWTTGISIADVNADGYLDIYLCKSGPPGGSRRKNELLINNGDLTFTDKAKEFGLDFEGLSTHAAFFDFDRDGDLDCYLLNNSIRSVGAYDLRKDQRQIPDTLGGNALLRNDKGRFTDISAAAGIYSSSIGFGLGVTVGDVNGDRWPDLYVSNDFFEKDYLYINNQDGTFSESLEQYLSEISLGSMGADMADINNDGNPEIFVTEMLPETDERLKTTAQFENWDKFITTYQQGYYRQFSRNVLQLNNGDHTFSEISRFAHVEATDWSWGALIFDMDNDGWKDIFVANGMYKDLLDQDYINFASNPNSIRKILKDDKGLIRRLVDSIPSNRVGNFAFRNNGNLTFSNEAEKWGLAEPSFSNGSAYGDLDNDGDLDLVINNVNMPAFVMENRTKELFPQHSSLEVYLHGKGDNPFAVGSLVTVYADSSVYTQELSPMRGFMSTVGYKLSFGLGTRSKVDSVAVDWPDGTVSVVAAPAVNQRIDLFQKDANAGRRNPRPAAPPVFTVDASRRLEFRHAENEYVDFDRDPLIFTMASNEGPCTCTGDVNGDGLTDVYVGGARYQAGSLFLQSKAGGFVPVQQELFNADAASEDTDCIFFDSNGDGALDLYVTSGGTEFSSTSLELLDRLYMNRNGKFSKSPQLLPGSSQLESTSSVAAGDVDGDGDMDLFAGARLLSGMYGLPAGGHVLINDGKGNFQEATDSWAPAMKQLGMITDAKWVDVNNDGRIDLVVVGDWMAIKVYENTGGILMDRSDAYGLTQTEGWYHTLEVADLNADGFMDLVVGNHGLNSRFRATASEPVKLYVNDFDRNGTIEQITTRYYQGTEYPFVLRSDLVRQLPVLKKKYLQFSAYSSQRMEDIFNTEQLASSTVLMARTMESAAWINDKGMGFRKAILPSEAQFAPVYAIATGDFNGDGHVDLVLGGNQFRAKPESGIYAASRGLLLLGDGKANFKPVMPSISGLSTGGEIRQMKQLVIGDKKYLMVTKNNDEVTLYKY